MYFFDASWQILFDSINTLIFLFLYTPHSSPTMTASSQNCDSRYPFFYYCNSEEFWIFQGPCVCFHTYVRLLKVYHFLCLCLLIVCVSETSWYLFIESLIILLYCYSYLSFPYSSVLLRCNIISRGSMVYYRYKYLMNGWNCDSFF